MRRLSVAALVAALLALPLGLMVAGCSDDAGGNEAGVMDKTEGGKGTVDPNYPKTEEQFYEQMKNQRKK
jgi:hypothetical protein